MRALIGLSLALALTVAFADPTARVWAQLTVDQQEALRPLQQRWHKLPDYQRARLLRAARNYAALSATQQQRFRQRLALWAGLSLEQRNRARTMYREYHRMPKAEQTRLGKLWRDQHPESELAQFQDIANDR